MLYLRVDSVKGKLENDAYIIVTMQVLFTPKPETITILSFLYFLFFSEFQIVSFFFLVSPAFLISSIFFCPLHPLTHFIGFICPSDLFRGWGGEGGMFLFTI